MSLPAEINLDARCVATWDINQNGKKVKSITMNFGTDPDSFNKKGDQKQLPDTNVAMFYNTDTKQNGWLGRSLFGGSNPNTLQTDNYPFQGKPLTGKKLYGFFLLPVSIATSTEIIIGPTDGEAVNGASFPAAATLTYQFDTQKSSKIAGLPSNTQLVLSSPVTSESSLYGTFSYPYSALGVQFTLTSIQKNVILHLVDDSGNVRGIMDSNSLGLTFWFDLTSSNLHLLAPLIAQQDTSNPGQWDFVVGDPRVDGSMISKEV